MWSPARALATLSVTLTLSIGLAGCAADDPPLDTEASAVLADPTIAPRSTWRYWDRGGDLGTAWAARGFDDSTWASGGGPLGYGESYLVTTVGYGGNASAKHVTTYFRRAFTVDDPAAVTGLRAEVMYDDGIVVYLNGTRIDDESMPAGATTGSTFALGHEAGNAYVAYDWSAHAGLLVAGTNVIAVEVHQVDRTSSDLVFDLALALERAGGGPLVARRATWEYYAPAQNQPPPTDWMINAGAATGAGAGPLGYGEPYVATQLPIGGTSTNKRRTTYFRRLFTVPDTSNLAALRGELMVDDGAVVYLNGTRIDAFNMPAGTIDYLTFAASSREAGNAYVTRDWTAWRHRLVAGTNMLSVEVHQDDPTSSDLVFDLSLVAEAAPPPPPPPPVESEIHRRSMWRVHAGSSTPPFWDDVSLDDSGWSLLAAPIGYGESYLQSTVPYGGDPANKWNTTFFRHGFFVEDPAQVAALVAEVMYDDGVVVYLNGTEVARRSMPSGYIFYATPALWHEANNAYETIDLAAARRHLRPGHNVIAVEVHQDDRASSDLVFDLALRVTAMPPPPSITRRATWYYWDEGGDLGTAWRTQTGAASGWDLGNGIFSYGWFVPPYRPRTELSYGGDPANRHMTTYFRRTLTVADPAAITSIRGELLYDDGVVIHVNGVELRRFAMPTGAITAATPSTGHEATTYEAFDATAQRALFRAGVNVIAVEVHQSDPASSDLVFDLALQVNTAATPRIAGCEPATPAPDVVLTGVWIAPSGQVWASGYDGLVGRRTGGVWTWCSVDVAATWSAVWGAADDDVWVAGSGGRLVRWNGSTWTAIDAGTTNDLRAVWGDGAGAVYAVGGGSWRRWDGANRQDGELPDGRFLDVWGASPTDVWATAQRTPPHDFLDPCDSLIYRWDPVARDFALEAVFPNDHGACGFEGLGGSGATDVWAVGEDHPAGAATGYAAAVRYDGTSWSWASGGDTFIEDRMYTAVAPWGGGVWITAVGDVSVRWDGASWTEGPAITEHLNAIDARGTTMFAVGYDGKVLRWDAGGWIKELGR